MRIVRSWTRVLTVTLTVIVCYLGAACDDDSTGGSGTETIDMDTVFLGCAVIESCDILPDSPWENVADCARAYAHWINDRTGAEAAHAPYSNAHMTCLAQAGNCAAAVACNGDDCFASDSYCDGDTLVHCVDGHEVGIDCSDIGGRCLTFTWGAFEGRSTCGMGTCTQAEPNDWRCEDTKVVRCDGGVLFGAECADQPGLVDGICVAEGPDAECVSSPGQACNEVDFVSFCEGNVLHQCVMGRIARYDCTQMELYSSCNENIDGYGRCVLEGPTCLEFDEGGCNGDVLTFCLHGALFEFDCSRIGLPCYDGSFDSHCGSGPF